MELRFDGTVHVEYGFWWLGDVDAVQGDLADGFRGQANGLLGGAVDGWLWGRTGLHSGPVAITVELHGQPPADDADAEEVVETSWRPPGGDVTLGAFEEFHELGPLPGGPWLRARLSTVGTEEADGVDSLPHDAEPVERLVLATWPEPTHRPDEVVRVTGTTARRWHAAPAG